MTVYEGNWANLNLRLVRSATPNSYFHLAQTSGVIFNRQTSVEAQRRADVVRPSRSNGSTPSSDSWTMGQNRGASTCGVLHWKGSTDGGRSTAFVPRG
jgi:hypothetical protein